VQKRKIVILGATGSVGEAAIAIVRKHPQQFELLGVAANRNASALQAIVEEFGASHSTLYCEEGLNGLLRLATLPEADLVLIATTGTIGLRPTVAALEAGKDVGLANKETLVLGGHFVMEVAARSKGTLLPVDSEHNAIFQCLQALRNRADAQRLILTASGGPFLNWTTEELDTVTPEQALKHPNWEMGTKITIDSATMANKGLEMIEARWLFNMDPANIAVVIHPQSLIHSMVECLDGSIIAQIAPPSMEFPVQHVLSYPKRLPAPQRGLDLTQIHALEMRPPDLDKFPCLRLAKESLLAGPIGPPVYNAANTVAVEAFLDGALSFKGIPQLIETCLENAHFPVPESLDHLLDIEPDLDAFARSQLKALS
jgi:1-deoxy-D-xylulose-5-phosphate reductoisomerase